MADLTINPALEELARRLDRATSVVLTTHSRPDGDGLGCLVALARALERKGKRVLRLIPDALGTRYRFLDPNGEVRSIDKLPKQSFRNDYDLALVLDTYERKLLHGVDDWLRHNEIETFFLDHHPMPGPPRSEVYGDTTAVATGCLVYRILVDHLGWALERAVAEPLYVAISFDTNSFKYLRNDPEAFEIAAALIREGVETNWVYRQLFASNPRSKVKALGWTLSNLRYECEGQIASVHFPFDIAVSLGLDRDDLRDCITYILEIEGVELAAALEEFRPGEIHVSLRSKGSYSVDGIAVAFGGGGHKLAAGFTRAGSLEDAWDQIEPVLVGALEGDVERAQGRY